MNDVSRAREFLKDKEIDYKKTIAESFETAELYNNFLAKNQNILGKFFQQIY